MGNQMTVEQAARTVIAALKHRGHSKDEVRNVMRSLYHGKAWNEYDMATAVCEAFVEAR